MSFTRPGNYPFPKGIADPKTKDYLEQLYRSLIDKDRGGEFFIDRSPSKDLKELIVRPEWYGAKGDGITDDTVAIQAAITAAGATSCVLFDEKTYICGSATLNFATGTRVVGINKYYSILKLSASVAVDLLTANAKNNISIENMTIDCSAATTTAPLMCLNAINCNNVRLVNNIFIGQKRANYITRIQGTTTSIEGVHIEGNTYYRGAIPGAATVGSFCFIAGSDIYPFKTVRDIYIGDNLFSMKYAETAGHNTDAMELVSCLDSRIIHNIIENDDVAGSSEFVCGIAIDSNCSTPIGINTNFIRGCQVGIALYGAQLYVLDFTDGKTDFVAGETVTQATSGATAVVTGATVDAGSWAGGDAAGTLTIYSLVGAWDGTNNISSGATLRATAGSVPSYAGNQKEMNVVGNNISGCSFAGVYNVSFANSNIISNIISSNTDYGICVGVDADHNIIANNFISDTANGIATPTGCGIFSNTPNNILVGNWSGPYSSTQAYGIYIGGSGPDGQYAGNLTVGNGTANIQNDAGGSDPNNPYYSTVYANKFHHRISQAGLSGILEAYGGLDGHYGSNAVLFGGSTSTPATLGAGGSEAPVFILTNGYLSVVDLDAIKRGSASFPTWGLWLDMYNDYADIRRAPIGTANSVISDWSSLLRVDANGNLGINQATFGTSAAKVMAQGTGTAPSDSPANAYQQYSADAGGVGGQAGPHFRTEGGGIFGMRSDTGTTLQYVYQKDDLADDGTVTLPDATSGTVIVSCNAEAGMWLVQSDGTCTKISGSTNTANTDSDGSLCVYNGGSGAVVKNRLGTTGETRIVYFYN